MPSRPATPDRPRILLIGNYPPDRQMSMARYADLLRDGLTERGFEVCLIHPARVVGGGVDDGAAAKWLGYVDKYILFPLQLGRIARGYDRVHVCDHSNAVYLPHVGPRASITCHDLIAINGALGRYPGHPTGLAGRVLQRWILGNLRRAARVVSVSTKTEEDLRALGWSGDGRVIGNCANFDFHPVAAGETSAAKARLGLAEADRYLIHVGGNQWYKNRIGVVRIYAELRKSPAFATLRLVMAGKPWPDDLRREVQRLGLEDWIMEAVGVSNEDIRALYSGAQALLFPSLMEGYGWPVLEAQSCGCPVITSNRAPLTEVAGAAAVLIDPTAPVVAAQTIMEQAPRFGTLAVEGLENARRFSRDVIMDAYADFLAGPRRRAAEG